MMTLDENIATLERTPLVLVTYLRELPDSLLKWRDGDAWSPYQIVGHFVHSESTDWITRAGIILEKGTDQTFEPFDRDAQDRLYSTQSIAELLDLFRDKRRDNLKILRGWNLKTEDLQRKGTHPEFGEVTLGQLLTTWTVHDHSHIAQIARTLARRFRKEVGPWRAYLPVLDPRPRS